MPDNGLAPPNMPWLWQPNSPVGQPNGLGPPMLNYAAPPDATTSQGADVLAGKAQQAWQWLQDQRAESTRQGLLDPDTGLPTQKGVVEGLRDTAQGVMMGTTAPVVPKLTAALRVGDQLVTGANHQALERDYPELANDAASQLGFVNPVGRWLTRPQAFQYALDHDLIDPKRAAEAQRFKDAMEETGNQRNLFLPSEWLRKYGLAGLIAGGGAAAAATQQQQPSQ